MFCDEWKKDQFLLSSHLYKSSDFPELFVQSTSLGSQGSTPTPERKKHFFFTRPSLLPFHLLLCHSLTHNSIALRRFFTPLFSPPSLTSISIFPLAPCLLFHLTPPSLPQWNEGNRVSSFESDGALTGWNLCPIPRACSCARSLQRLPPHTHIHTEPVGIHPPTHMHAYIYRAGKGAHMCT